jgi:hypothetical protein
MIKDQRKTWKDDLFTWHDVLAQGMIAAFSFSEKNDHRDEQISSTYQKMLRTLPVTKDDLMIPQKHTERQRMVTMFCEPTFSH